MSKELSVFVKCYCAMTQNIRCVNRGFVFCFRSDVSAQIDVKLESGAAGTDGAFVGARARCGGCDIQYANGVVCWFYTNSTVRLTANFSKCCCVALFALLHSINIVVRAHCAVVDMTLIRDV